MGGLVVLLKGTVGEPSAPDPYEQALQQHGFDTVAVPVLRVQLCNSHTLAQLLADPAVPPYAALVVTSPRALAALQHAMGSSLQPAWATLPVYVVGPATANGARALGFTDVRGKEAGCGAVLAEIILGQQQAEGSVRPLLHLCGDRRRDELPAALQAAGVPLHSLCVYESAGSGSVAEDLQQAVGNRRPVWAVFFSPSGVDAALAALEVLEAARGPCLVAAIGATTAAALRAAGRHVAATAQRPSPDALAEALASSQ